MSLKDKLKALQQTPKQCACGSKLAGECPECDGKQETSIIGRLQNIGAKGVNPPAPTHGEATRPVTPEPVATDGACPHCKKTFKQLSRHKCKLAPETAAKPEPTPREQNDKAWERVVGETVPLTIPVKVTSRWGTDQVPLYQVEYTPEIGTAEHPAPLKFDVVGSDLHEQANKAHEMVDAMVNGMSDVGVAEEPKPTEEMAAIAFMDRVEPAEEPAPSSPGYFILLLDCISHEDLDADVIDLAELIEPLCDAVAKENQVPHWKCVEFGKGAGLLAAKLDRMLTAQPVSGFLRASSAEMETSVCLSVLKRHARNVIQGIQ